MHSECANKNDILNHSTIKKIVIKIGTSSINRDDGTLNHEFMNSIAKQVSHILSLKKQVIIVSSGAIGIGLDVLKLKSRPLELQLLQAASAIGQNILMQEWNCEFKKYNLTVAQVLLTYESFSNRISYLNIRNTLSTLLDYNIIPIINENDFICLDEIEANFGDNDKLSAIVASKIEADLLIVLSDIDGLYDKNPKKNKDAKLIKLVRKITPGIESYGGKSTSMKGVGGMRAKIEAAKICGMAGCHMVIANSDIEDGIIRIINGEKIGTLFIADKELYKDKNKVRWILLVKPSGKIIVDEGAKSVLLKKKAGLLPSGIKKVIGAFNRGDIVDIECGEVFAKGIVDYSSSELEQIKGVHTNEINKILGIKTYHSNVINKENLCFINNNYGDGDDCNDDSNDKK
ncbi:MAG: glutamate 5-kinase [Methanosarcinaceae archaeon]|nr:glutamate 5-kinase [Methanosarcinaceae archaeon]